MPPKHYYIFSHGADFIVQYVSLEALMTQRGIVKWSVVFSVRLQHLIWHLSAWGIIYVSKWVLSLVETLQVSVLDAVMPPSVMSKMNIFDSVSRHLDACHKNNVSNDTIVQTQHILLRISRALDWYGNISTWVVSKGCLG